MTVGKVAAGVEIRKVTTKKRMLELLDFVVRTDISS